MTDKMTPEVAISHIEEILSEVPNYDESLDYELSSHDFDWLEEAKKALEARAKKQPKNRYTEETGYQFMPTYEIDGTIESAKFGSCPSCGFEVQEGMKFCTDCGQALDWSE